MSKSPFLKSIDDFMKARSYSPRQQVSCKTVLLQEGGIKGSRFQTTRVLKANHNAQPCCILLRIHASRYSKFRFLNIQSKLQPDEMGVVCSSLFLVV